MPGIKIFIEKSAINVIKSLIFLWIPNTLDQNSAKTLVLGIWSIICFDTRDENYYFFESSTPDPDSRDKDWVIRQWPHMTFWKIEMICFMRFLMLFYSLVLYLKLWIKTRIKTEAAFRNLPAKQQHTASIFLTNFKAEN